MLLWGILVINLYFIIYCFCIDFQAEEITLTIGQAFDLAYRRFLETQGKDVDLKKQQIVLQKKVNMAFDPNLIGLLNDCFAFLIDSINKS